MVYVVWWEVPIGRPLLVTFAGGPTGLWSVDRLDAVRGEALSAVERLAVVEGDPRSAQTEAAWLLRGVTSNERYLTRAEHEVLVARQEGLGRSRATRAALIPIRKTEEWWELPQDERRAIFEERSRHVATGLEYLPAIARRLHHGRDLNEHGRDLNEPFDFLTWFEYAPEDADAFEELTARLRETEEWSYVEREIDIRLSRYELASCTA